MLQALRPVARRGDRVLVIGASGGVGHCAVQIAVAKYSADVTAVCSAANEAFVRRCGATTVVDYTDGDVVEKLTAAVAARGPFDVVLDTVSSSDPRDADYAAALLGARPPLVAPARRNYIVLGGSPAQWAQAALRRCCGVDASRAPLQLFWIAMPHSKPCLVEAAALVDELALKPRVSAAAFDDAGLREAFGQIRSRRTAGKIVVDVAPDSTTRDGPRQDAPFGSKACSTG